MSLWITGGKQRIIFGTPPEHTQFESAVIARVDGERPSQAFQYKTPTEKLASEKKSTVFKAATITDERAYLCTETEVLVCRFPDFEIERLVSLPIFNDVHHVVPADDGSLWVVITGLDAVAQISPDDEVLRLTDVLGRDVWDKFDRDTDYRMVATTKPHDAHPNYLFFIDGAPWVTRFKQRDAACLDDLSRTIPVGDRPLHDGHVVGDHVLFTSVDGHVFRINHRSGQREVFDLNELSTNKNRPLGWCRGLLPTEEGLWVGFTRLRYTRLKENLSWIRHGFTSHAELPTRIALYDLDSFGLIREVDLEGVDQNAVFSIHQAPAPR
ncbi:MAG: hypothetical protein DWQ31_11545 [Planctomycetota bacterium]|nr:MAG: hypothetical protein DWQ31_12555 [Planctomycetota bacterium]REJ67409.1 MAG: hypothetical protein DWQ31_11545 [Planctomycetota bacterium]REJ89307.1 MAG: hypothetical protein DWQ35_18395 [Planctomycetota bacterium]REK22882.1 MAG: hypothetical protein DWQ42_16360 [Planctomycetota bacterium]REK37418.1 MAG: hypothetical protein DWQ46_22315 [Planctomycetota bacterium]